MKETIDVQEKDRVFSLINKKNLTNLLSKELKIPVSAYLTLTLDDSKQDYQLIIREQDPDSFYKIFKFYFRIKPKYVFQLMESSGKSPQDIGSFLVTRMLVSYLNGNILKDMEDKNEDVWKLSSELNVSSYFSDNLGFPESKDFDLPKGMSAEYYYEELMKKLNNNQNDSNNQVGNNQKDNDSNDNLESLRDKKFQDSINKAIENLPNSSNIDQTVTKTKGNSADIPKIMNDISYKSYVAKIVNKICKNIIVEERKVDIVPMQKKSSYYSINKKHMNSSIILPGKKYERTGTTKKFNKTGVIFVDVSYSTSAKFPFNDKNIKVPLEFIIQETGKELQEKYGLQIVYYNMNICGIVKNSKDFYYCESDGGTSIVDVFEEYMELEKLQSIERLYVISDGDDDYKDLFTKHENKIIQNEPQIYVIGRGSNDSVDRVIENGKLEKM